MLTNLVQQVLILDTIFYKPIAILRAPFKNVLRIKGSSFYGGDALHAEKRQFGKCAEIEKLYVTRCSKDKGNFYLSQNKWPVQLKF